MFKNNIFKFCNILFFIYLITLKIEVSSNNVISFIYVYILVSLFLNSFIKSNVLFINYNIIFFIFFIFFINNLVTFFLFIEIYSIIFYFFFLNSIQVNKSINLLKQKNMLLLYLFNNFFVTILFLFGIFFIIDLFGTVNLTELNYISNYTPY